MKRALAVATIATLLGCGQAAPPEPAAPAVQLYAMECGRIAITDAAAFADDGAFNGVARDFIDPCYLIRHPAGDLLWDSGFSDAIADMPDGLRLDGLNAHVTVSLKLAAQLTQLGVNPSEIEFISFSHSHGDHVGNAALFPDAIWIADADERTFMFRADARDDDAFAAYAHLENAETRRIEGDGDFDVFGDGSVTIIQAPGHTPGHTVLLVRLANAGPVLLTGDLYHLAESRARRTVPTFNFNRDQTLASMDKVERIAGETEALVIRQHVQEDFDALPRFPEALN